MRTLTVFNQVTLDGFFTGPNGDLSWAHRNGDGEQDADWSAFVAENASSGGELLFGRITYEMMESHWSTPAAHKDHPTVAESMNALPKAVFSRTMTKANWNNTKLVKGDLATEVRRMKKNSGPDMVILGSGSIVSQLTREGLIDAFQLVVNPVVLGRGRTLFEGLREKLALELTSSRTFKNGNVLLCQRPIR